MGLIEVSHLSKIYNRFNRKIVAVDDLSFSVPQGCVFGFLGPNGAGKTTTIRCLLGMVRLTSGECTILGANSQRDLHRVIEKVGTFVEAPGFLPTFSGKLNLELLARQSEIRRGRVSEVLERVGLNETDGIPFGKYSLGMKQRLSIAAAMLKDPEIFILDEPANGLDPAGIAEVRETVRALGREGKTVLISSHLLTEVQQTCDRVVIISKGRTVASGKLSEVLSSKPKGFLLRVSDTSRTLEVLSAAKVQAAETEDGRIRLSETKDPGSIVPMLVSAGVDILELVPVLENLETVFMELTEGDRSGGTR